MCNFNAPCCCHHPMSNATSLASDFQSETTNSLANENVSYSASSNCAGDTNTKPLRKQWTEEPNEFVCKSSFCVSDFGPVQQSKEIRSKQRNLKNTSKRKLKNQVRQSDSPPMMYTRPECLENKKDGTMWFECNVPIRVGIPGTVSMNTPCNLFDSNMQLEIADVINNIDTLSSGICDNSLVKSCYYSIPPKTELSSTQPIPKSKLYITVRPLGYETSAMPRVPAEITPAVEPKTQQTVPKPLPKKKVFKRTAKSPQPKACTCSPNGSSGKDITNKALSNFVEALRLVEVICQAKCKVKANTQKNARKHKKNIPSQRSKRFENSCLESAAIPVLPTPIKLSCINSSASFKKNSNIDEKRKINEESLKAAPENAVPGKKAESILKVCKCCSKTSQSSKKGYLQKYANKFNDCEDKSTHKKACRTPLPKNTEKGKKLQAELEPKGLQDLLASLRAPAICNKKWFANNNDPYRARKNRSEYSSHCKYRSHNDRPRSKIPMNADPMQLKVPTNLSDASRRLNAKKSRRPFNNYSEDESVISENESRMGRPCSPNCTCNTNSNFSRARRLNVLKERQRAFLHNLRDLAEDQTHQSCNCFTKSMQDLQEPTMPVSKGRQHQQVQKQKNLQQKSQRGKHHTQYQQMQSKNQQEQQLESDSQQQHKNFSQDHKFDPNQQWQEKHSQAQQLQQHIQQNNEQNFEDIDSFYKVPQQQQPTEHLDLQQSLIQQRIAIEGYPKIQWSDKSSDISQSSRISKSTRGNPKKIMSPSSSTSALMVHPKETNNMQYNSCKCSEYRRSPRILPTKFYMETLKKYGIKFMPGDCLNSDPSSVNSFQAYYSNA